MTETQDDEIVLDSAAPGVTVTLTPVAEPPPPPAPVVTAAPGFGDDEWAGQLADGRVLAFLREPVARCHCDRLLLVDGARRTEQPLPPWNAYGQLLAVGPRGFLIGGVRSAWLLDPAGALTTIADEPDGISVHVCWLPGDCAVAAGWTSIVFDGPKGRFTLPCNHAVGAFVVAPDLLVVSDDDGSQWIKDGRVVARDWQPYAEARGDVVLNAAGEAYRVRVIEA